jgi:hypothetical protein
MSIIYKAKKLHPVYTVLKEEYGLPAAGPS